MRRGGPPSSVLSGSSFREAGHQEQPHSAAAAQPHPGPTARSPPRRRPRTPPAATAPAPTPGRGVVVDDQHGPGHRPIVAWAKCASHRGYPGLPPGFPIFRPAGLLHACADAAVGRLDRSLGLPRASERSYRPSGSDAAIEHLLDKVVPSGSSPRRQSLPHSIARPPVTTVEPGPSRGRGRPAGAAAATSGRAAAPRMPARQSDPEGP
jgi:hypothetical protein